MQAKHFLSPGRILVLLVAPLVLSGCFGEGDGPERIPGTPAPEVPPGFCDSINFEDLCGPVNFTNFGGTAAGAGGIATVITNPDASGINTSDRVAQLQKFAGEVFAGSAILLDDTIDFAAGEAFTMKVWASRSVPVLFKLEDAVSGDPNLGKERTANHSGSSSWEEYCFDFSGDVAGFSSDQITLIFDITRVGDAENNPDDWTFFVDDITQVEGCGSPPADPVNLPVGFEGDPASYDFGAEAGFGGGVATVIPNPDQSGLNTTAQTARMQKFAGEVFGGATLALSDPIDFGDGEAFKMKVWATREVPVLFKLEDAVTGLPENGKESSVSHSGSGAWEELCFDFSGNLAGFSSDSITFIFDLGVAGDAENNAQDWTFYFDEIEQVASCDDGGGGADPGIVPDVVIFSSSAPPDLVFGEDYTGFEPFGSGSTFDNNVTTDPDFNPAFGVTTGDGYGAQVGQFAIVGFEAGFASGFGTLDFKAKGLNNDLIRVKFLDGGEYLDINLVTSEYSTALGNGWYQVTVPISDFTGVATATALLFETDNTAASAFTFLLTDFGFSGTSGADPGIVPDVVIFSSTAPPDLVFGVDYTGFEPFGSGSTFDNNVTTDPDFNPAFGVTTGDGYGAQVGQFAIVGFQAGFASGFETLDFKAKGLNNDLIRVKFLDDGDYLDIVLTGSAFSTALGNGWYQVSIPLTSFTGVDTATALLFETDNTAASAFTFLLTDFGFSGSRGPANSPNSIIPENVIFATDPTVPVDFVFGVDYTGFEAFGSGSIFNTEYADDPGFIPAIAITSGTGYGANIAQFAIVGFAPGFASGFGTLDFKIKGIPDDLVRIRFLDGGDYVDIDLATSDYALPLGSDWYQVSIPLSVFTGVDTATALLFESNNTSPTQFTFLLTDIGFSGTPDTGGELLVNGDFETSDADKAPWINSGGVVTNNYYTATANDGEQVFQTNLSQVVALTQGADYILTFRARANVARTMLAGIGLNVAPFTAATESVALTTEWQTFTFNLNAAADIGTAESRVLFDMGGVASTINIDDVSLALASAPGVNLLVNGDFEASDADKAPWINSGGIATNNYYAATAADGEPAFQTNLSQVVALTQGTDYVLTFRARASVPRNILAGIGLNVSPFTAATETVALTTEWQTFTYTLNASADIGTAESRVLFDMGGVASTVNIDDVSLTVAGGGGGGGTGGELAENGGLEDGGLDVGWTVFPGGGTVSVVSDAFNGSFAAALVASAGQNPVLKQQEKGAGVVAQGDTINVSFAMKGSVGPGGVIFVEFFSENSAGVDQQFLGGGPIAPTADWTTYTFSPTVTGDAARGITLQFAAVCGAVDGCSAQITVDDVSMTVAGE